MLANFSIERRRTMARQFGRYKISTHSDPDWGKLTTTQHDIYMALLSSPDIDWAGVVPYFPSRFAMFAADLTERKVERAWQGLAELGYLVIDKSMGEVLVRTFIKHDEVLSKPNITKAMLTAFDRIRSDAVREALVDELHALADEKPNLRGWDAVHEQSPELFRELFMKEVA